MPSVAVGPSVFEIDCACGQKLTVTAGQAGSQIACVCGKSVDVPTIRELRRLAGPESKVVQKSNTKIDPRAAQDENSRLVFSVMAIGLVLGGLAIAASFYFFQSSIENQEVDPRFLAMLNTANEKIDEAPINDLWEEWKHYRDVGLGEHQVWTPVLNKQRAQSALYGIYFGLGTAGLGAILFLFAMILPRRTAIAKA